MNTTHICVYTDIGAAMSGLVADARTLIDHARVESQVTLYV